MHLSPTRLKMEALGRKEVVVGQAWLSGFDVGNQRTPVPVSTYQSSQASTEQSRTTIDPGPHRGMGRYKYGYGRSLCCCSDLCPSLLAWNRGCSDAGIRATDRASRVSDRLAANESARPGTLFPLVFQVPVLPHDAPIHPSIHPVLDPPEIAISPIPSGVAGW